ncbi:hypothetical protein [Carboxylicivirga sp. RSCT41]|uniref:hypothetical protein n=1 Tax=Carboxylicivirga agarovorans TaxID=3417570 RepID=UPI003D34308F
MTHITSRFLAFVMIGVLLLTSSGFKLYSHYCSHKNVANYSIFIPASSCYTPVKASCYSMEVPETCNSECSSSCCNDDQHFSRYEIESHSSIVSANIDPVEIDVFNAGVPQLNVVEAVGNYNVVWHLASEPPPPSVNKFLSITQVYLN